jgi:hypothetical protein
MKDSANIDFNLASQKFVGIAAPLESARATRA